MHNQKSQIFDDLKTLLLIDNKYRNDKGSMRLNPVAVENGRMNNKKNSQLNRHHFFSLSHDDAIIHGRTMGSLLGQNTSIRHAQNLLFNAVVISICMTALMLSMGALPIIFKVIAFCGSLMVGFIIEIMLNGDEYE